MIKKHFLFFIILIIASCSSSEKSTRTVSPLTKENLDFSLVPGTWQISVLEFASMVEDVNKKTRTEFIKKMKDSSVITLYSDHRYEEAIIKQKGSGIWKIDSLTNTLIIEKLVPDTVILRQAIQYLDATTMKAAFIDDEGAKGYLELTRKK